MQVHMSRGPGWAVFTVWALVNAVNLLQSAGFLSRVLTGGRSVNHVLGYVMIALAVVPYLVLFFGAILLMGLPMFRLNRGLWLVTVATTTLLPGSMGVAMYKGVG